MDLFLTALTKEIKRLQKGNVRLRVIGDISPFPVKLQNKIREAQDFTASNNGLLLQIAANYGGRWDITQATRTLASQVKEGILDVGDINEASVAAHLCCADTPDPDLFIRTGGEQRISNFLLWQSAYSELYFTDVLWPDFGLEHFRQALKVFSSRQRRFGRTSSQIEQTEPG